MSSRFSRVASEMEFSFGKLLKNKECALKMRCVVYLDSEYVEFVVDG